MRLATQRRRPIAVLTGVALLVVILAIIDQVHGPRPPITPANAAVRGAVWTMPADQVRPFLRARGVDGMPPAIDGTAVVARVQWSPAELTDGTFTVLLGDERSRSGVITDVYGPPGSSVALGNGTVWDAALAKHDWLMGDGTQRLPRGGYSAFGQFASIPTSWSGAVWVVGNVITPPGDLDGIQPAPVPDPRPVLGVALSSGSRVWWIEEVARA